MTEEQHDAAQRAESAIVQNFSADLDSMFGLSDGRGVGALEQTVEQKKQHVSSASEQLQELEAKLRETEQRLARVSRHSSPSRPATTGLSTNHPEQQQVVSGAGKSPLGQNLMYPDDRPPPTAARPQIAREDTDLLTSHMPGALPQTPQPQNATGDYVMVDRGDGRAEPSVVSG